MKIFLKIVLCLQLGLWGNLARSSDGNYHEHIQTLFPPEYFVDTDLEPLLREAIINFKRKELDGKELLQEALELASVGNYPLKVVTELFEGEGGQFALNKIDTFRKGCVNPCCEDISPLDLNDFLQFLLKSAKENEKRTVYTIVFEVYGKIVERMENGKFEELFRRYLREHSDERNFVISVPGLFPNDRLKIMRDAVEEGNINTTASTKRSLKILQSYSHNTFNQKRKSALRKFRDNFDGIDITGSLARGETSTSQLNTANQIASLFSEVFNGSRRQVVRVHCLEDAFDTILREGGSAPSLFSLVKAAMIESVTPPDMTSLKKPNTNPIDFHIGHITQLGREDGEKVAEEIIELAKNLNKSGSRLFLNFNYASNCYVFVETSKLAKEVETAGSFNIDMILSNLLKIRDKNPGNISVCLGTDGYSLLHRAKVSLQYSDLCKIDNRWGQLFFIKPSLSNKLM